MQIPLPKGLVSGKQLIWKHGLHKKKKGIRFMYLKVVELENGYHQEDLGVNIKNCFGLISKFSSQGFSYPRCLKPIRNCTPQNRLFFFFTPLWWICDYQMLALAALFKFHIAAIVTAPPPINIEINNLKYHLIYFSTFNIIPTLLLYQYYISNTSSQKQ